MGSPLSLKEDKFVRPCVRHDRHAPRRATPGTPAAVRGWGKQTCVQWLRRGDEFIFEIRFIWRDQHILVTMQQPGAMTRHATYLRT